MSAVEDTREARERAERLLREVASGRIGYDVLGDYFWVGGALLDTIAQATMRDLTRIGLVGHGSEEPPMLTDKGRDVLGVSAGPALSSPPPPLLCDGVIHVQGEQPPAVVVCAETTGGMKRMVLCRDCGQRYALDAACLALAGFEINPSAPPVAIHLIPIPRPTGPKTPL